MFIKVVYNWQCHVYNSKGDPSFMALHKYIGEVFKKLPAKYYLTYFDDEDEITLACDSDFETMSQLFDKKPAKIYIKEVDESYYDETQKVVLDDEAVERIEEKMEELKITESEAQVLIPEPEAPKTEDQDADLTTQISPIEEEKPNVSVQDTQPEITEETIQKAQEYNQILDQSEVQISQVSQITEAQIEEKFREMIPEFMEKVKKSLLNNSTVKSESSQKPKIVHNHITCDECSKKNIEGIRYKCAVCADFDLCQKCEVTSTHDHPFLKIKHPGQTPFKIIAIVRDEQENSFEVNGNRVQLPQFPFFDKLFDAFCPRPPRHEGHHERFGHHGFGHHGFGPNGLHGFGRGKRRGGNGCPFKSQFKDHEEMKEEKVEQKCEPQKKTKIEEEKPIEKPVEPKVVQKVEPKPEQKVEKRIPFEPKDEAPKKREQMKIEQDLKTEKVIIENAKYLFTSLDGFVDISEDKSCYFSKKHPGVTKEQLVELYFSEMP